jgi:hypothetical protein
MAKIPELCCLSNHFHLSYFQVFLLTEIPTKLHFRWRLMYLNLNWSGPTHFNQPSEMVGGNFISNV